VAEAEANFKALILWQTERHFLRALTCCN